MHLYVSEYPDLDTSLDLRTFSTRSAIGIPDDHGDSPADATLVAIPSSTTGEIGTSGDRDVFRMVVGEPGILRLSTRGDTDTYGSLSGSDGQVIATDDDGGVDLNFLIKATVGPGTWYVEVRGYSNSTVGSYLLDVAFEMSARSRQPQVSRRLGDFDGDGHDDVLLRRDDGAWWLYAMDGRRHVPARSGFADLTRNLRYNVAGVGDFDGDGRDDVLLRRDDGFWLFYAMDGRRHVPARSGFADLTRNLRYNVAGVGDFDGDGRDDVLLRRDDGFWLFYAMDGRRHVPARSGFANLTRNLRYQVAGIGDFDDDRRDDVLLRRDDGFWFYYAMNGRRYVNARSGFSPLNRNLRFDIAGIGDLDGDGRDDVLLRRDDGFWFYYAMDGRRPVGERSGFANLNLSLRWEVATRTAVQRGGRDGVIFGNLTVAEGQALDGDTLDPNDPVEENDTIATAQAIAIPVSVAGYADEDDQDVYRVVFPAPARVSLAISDSAEGDLDLELADADGNIVASSLGVGDLEVIQTKRTGEHFAVVRSFSGASNYSLVVSITETAGNSSQTASGLLASWSTDGEFIPDELIVKPDRAESSTLTSSMVAGLSPTVLAQAPSGMALWRVTEVASQGVLGAAAAPDTRYATELTRRRAHTLRLRKHLQRTGSFELVEPNYVYRPTAVPDDHYYPYQWHYPHVSLTQAWDLTTGSDDVVVAVIDTGVLTHHPDLTSRLLRDSRNRVVGYDFIRDPPMANDGDGIDPDPFDSGDSQSPGGDNSYHGTHVAGTIAAATNNRIGVAGVTWRGKVMPIRVLGVGGGTTFDIAQGVRYAAGLSNTSGRVPPVSANVVNMSLGRTNEACTPLGVDRITRDALESAIAAGAVVVVAAGNDNCHQPAPMTMVDGVISVGATDHFGRAPYSNFGSTIDVVAPGGNMGVDQNGDGYFDGVLSTAGSGGGGGVSHTYHFLQGTSMAAPHFAGIVALMLSVNGDLTPSDIDRLLAGNHPDPAADRISRDWGRSGRDDEYGHGLIDAHQAVRVARVIRGGHDGDPDRPVLAVSPTRLLRRDSGRAPRSPCQQRYRQVAGLDGRN